MAAADLAGPSPGAARRQGIVLLLVSALAFSSAGIFTKGVEAGAWQVIFWRGLVAAAATLVWLAWRLGARRLWRRELLGMGRVGLVVSLVAALGTAAFIPAFKLTTVANVALIYAAAPLLAAGLAWAWFGERPRRRALLGGLLALVGVGVIVGGSLGRPSLAGDLLAFAMTLAMASVMTIYRRYPETPAAAPMALSSLLLLGPAALAAPPLAVSGADLAWLAAFGLVFALAAATLNAGARHLPAGETALLSILEVPLAPLLAWLLLAEAPATATLLGGGLVLAAVLLALRRA